MLHVDSGDTINPTLSQNGRARTRGVQSGLHRKQRSGPSDAESNGVELEREIVLCVCGDHAALSDTVLLPTAGNAWPCVH